MIAYKITDNSGNVEQNYGSDVAAILSAYPEAFDIEETNVRYQVHIERDEESDKFFESLQAALSELRKLTYDDSVYEASVWDMQGSIRVGFYESE